MRDTSVSRTICFFIIISLEILCMTLLLFLTWNNILVKVWWSDFQSISSYQALCVSIICFCIDELKGMLYTTLTNSGLFKKV